MPNYDIHLRLTFSRKQIKFILGLALVIGAGYMLRADTMKLSTYYPAPSGVYKKIITTSVTTLARDGGNVLLAPAGGGVGIGTTNPAASAALDVRSSSKGLLPPRMSQAARDTIASPAAGLTVYNTDAKALEYFDGTRWSGAFLGRPGSVITVNLTPKTFTPSKFTAWTSLGSITTTKTTGAVLVVGSAVIVREGGMVFAALRIRDSENKVMTANQSSDYADSGGVIKVHPLNVFLPDTLEGTAKTYFLEVGTYYGGPDYASYGKVTATDTTPDYGTINTASAVGMSMSNAFWLKVMQF